VPGLTFVSFGQAKERSTPDPEESMQWKIAKANDFRNNQTQYNTKPNTL
jgi:hypothetical protein